MNPNTKPPEGEPSENTPPSVEEINDLAMLSEGELANPLCTPPPRIAARLHRSSNRKSASSSRRSSLTSIHSNRSSNRSSRSAHGGSHGTHVAQHLRRASILESRKARLADRHAHAEMVRLRAQQAKATPKNTRSPEERALAAQQAREKHLAQVAAACAEEVKRAKWKAEKAREKKEAESLKLKEEMEEKYADVERRRQQLQTMRRARTQSLPVVEEKKVALSPWRPKNEDLAARVIQKAWRNRWRAKVMSEFTALGLEVENVQAMSFEHVSQLVREDRVLIATAKLLTLCGLMEGDVATLAQSQAVRTYLSAYLVLGHPKHALSRSGEQEEDLIGKAKVLLVQMGRLLNKPPTEKTFSPSSDLLVSLTEAYNDFQTAFDAWKNHDSSFLIETMISQFVELDSIWQTVKNDTAGYVADDYREGIQHNQTLLLARLKRLLGKEKAFSQLNEAVRANRKAKARARKKKATAEVRPRAAPSVAGSSGSIASASSTALKDSDMPDEDFKVDDLEKVMQPLPENRILVHELALNKDFRIESDATSEARRKLNRAFFNAMRLAIADGEGDPWVLSLATTIRERLLRLVTQGKSLHSLISENLDAEIIERQLRMGTFSYDKFFSFMGNLLPKLCAPVRDDDVKDFANDTTSDNIERVQKLVHIIDLLALDHANYLLQVSGPELIRRAPEYEAQCFQDFLASNTLVRTAKWWRESLVKTNADLSRRTPTPDSTLPRPTPTKAQIYTSGLIDLFLTPTPIADEDIPEIFQLDAERIRASRASVLRIVTVSAMLLMAKNLLKRDVRQPWRTQAQRLWDLPPAGGGAPISAADGDAAYADAAPYLAALEAAAVLPPAVRTSLASTAGRVLADARALLASTPARPCTPAYPVVKVLLQKIRAHAAARLGAASAEDRLWAESTATEVLGRGGLVEFAGRIGALVDEMGRVRTVDWAAHGKWIDKVADEVGK